ncbi:MAG: hypothetical protein NT010_00685 [Proteobacteria bacterium]|nr:hypothetical protein [Pseudomonadota bacterium]
MKTVNVISTICICMLLVLLVVAPLYGKDDNIKPKEPGVYIKTDESLIRLLPNMVFNEQGLLFIESNNPAHFFLKNIEYFIVFGKYNIDILTLNPLLFFQASSVGKPRFAFGKDIEIDIKNKSSDLYILKPKALIGRGYYCIWIEDTVWDFVIE